MTNEHKKEIWRFVFGVCSSAASSCYGIYLINSGRAFYTGLTIAVIGLIGILCLVFLGFYFWFLWSVTSSLRLSKEYEEKINKRFMEKYGTTDTWEIFEKQKMEFNANEMAE